MQKKFNAKNMFFVGEKTQNKKTFATSMVFNTLITLIMHYSLSPNLNTVYSLKLKLNLLIYVIDTNRK